MKENISTKVDTIHTKAKWFQPRIPSWHRDKYAGDGQLVSSKYSYYKAFKKSKPSANGSVSIMTNPFFW